MLPEDELARLAADIEENGLLNPIVVDDEGRILDGRNRFAACKALGIEIPTTVVYDGDDPAGFVLSVNVARRHQSTGSRAMSTALVLADAGKRENGRWKRGALPDSTESRNTWQSAMTQAGTVLDFAPDLAADVVAGRVALDAAYRDAERRREYEREALEEQERIEAEEADALKKLADLAPDYLNKVGAEFKTGRQAFTAWEDDHRREAAEQRRNQAAAEKEAAEARKGRVALYSGISQSLATVSGYGNYPDLNTLMADFDPNELDRSVTDEFTADRLNSGIRFLTMLKEWSER